MATIAPERQSTESVSSEIFLVTSCMTRQVNSVSTVFIHTHFMIIIIIIIREAKVHTLICMSSVLSFIVTLLGLKSRLIINDSYFHLFSHGHWKFTIIMVFHCTPCCGADCHPMCKRSDYMRCPLDDWKVCNDYAMASDVLAARRQQHLNNLRRKLNQTYDNIPVLKIYP